MSEQAQARAGLVGLVTGILGAVAAVVLLAWSPQVASTRVSYPFTPAGFRVVQTVFFVHHFGLVVLLVALAMSSAVGGRLFRGGAWLAVLGMVLLAAAELFAMRYADWDNDVANSGAMGAAYGVASVTIGAGMLVAGVGVVRARVWTGWHRWMPLAVGIGLFAVVLPGIPSGFVTARLTIGFWMLQFALLGWSLHSQTRHAAPGHRRRGTAAVA